MDATIRMNNQIVSQGRVVDLVKLLAAASARELSIAAPSRNQKQLSY